MNSIKLTTTVLLLLSATALPVLAQSDPVESYCATMGEQDHFASDGYPLDNAAAIIRQDRANYHQFGNQDPSDENDSTFASKKNRARLEAMLRNGNISSSAKRAIVNGTPDVCLDIYEDYIDVTVQ